MDGTAGLEPATFWLRFRRDDHYTTEALVFGRLYKMS